ncbi:MAG: MATE family efflux transporter [Bulleidia sp.]|nr:MATE family efflux transporter [Bulleidia sp.]
MDWLLVFPAGLGMRGAALATVIGNALQTGIMLTHFISRNNTLKLIKPYEFHRTGLQIMKTGSSSSFLDLANVILLVLTNNQMQRYGGDDAMAAWGVVNTTAVFAQALFTGVGQSIQPAVSENYGAENRKRTQKFLFLAIKTTLWMAIAFMVIGELFPVQMTRVFMDVTPDILEAAPPMIRTYYLSFPFLSLNVLSTYYLQSVLRTKDSMTMALTRSLFLPAGLLIALPLVFQLKGVNSAVPVSELCVFLWQYWYYKTRMNLEIYDRKTGK